MSSDQKYIEIGGEGQDSAMSNAWLDFCQLKDLPCIVVRKHNHYADVHWDYISYPKSVDAVLEECAYDIRNSAIKIFARFANSRSTYEADNMLVSYYNLEIEAAGKAASELFDRVVACLGKKVAQEQ